ncbi:MAG: alanine racemase [Lachnospiraceae bacterium]|nr:alanine racemase [Lachnospiraceae bacterium]MEE1257900.1 alanine racemase [Lachnospiraceae bacterium]
MKHYDRVWAEVDLDAVTENIATIKKKIKPDTKMIPVIKTDGYGHGAIPIAKAVESEESIWGFCVATAEEAHVLREKGVKKPLLILGYTFPYSYEKMIEEEIRPTIFMLDVARLLSEKALKIGKVCRVHIKVDTGMTRIGIHPNEEGVELIRQVRELPGIEIEGIFTHFATADETDKSKSYRQLQMFQEFVDRIERELGIKIPMKHCSNSAGILEMPEANMDAVRAGIIIYGLWPSKEVQEKQEVELKPALTLKSRIVYVKMVTANQEISYGGTYITVRDTQVATICIGYGDGYPRSLSNIGYVLVNGQKAPILGRVCMDQFMIDVTDVKGEVCVGDVVTLIGRDNNEIITMEELGDLSGRFNYELACDIGKRVPRIYKVDDTLINE